MKAGEESVTGGNACSSVPITPRRKRTREKLISAAIPVFAAKGVAGTSIEELTEAAGLSRGAFYSNFTSRDELVLAVCDSAIHEAVDRIHAVADDGLEEAFNSAADMADKHTAVADAVQQYFAENAYTVDWVLAEREISLHAMRVPELRDKYEELVQAHRQQFAAVIGALLERLGGRATIALQELVSLLATVTEDAAMRAIARHSGTGPLVIDSTPALRVLLAFVEFD
ncbi:TetR/AcrR family transcriptional regulator [Brevibacterium daeguense]|uniref:TetR/AcrR family transcriptional regulator n=1 Tax=Brevibacterium daeguense TaxID=909936 RepID=A0ABP8EKL3_9MICO|nr:TetR/AcrR family transcriptional regulator [Brevibacterium daeguense]